MTPGATTTQTLPGAPTAPSAADDVRLVLVASLLGAAAVHASVVQDHLLEWSAAGQFFVSLTVAGVLAAGALVRRAGPEQLLAALAVSVLPLVVWLVSRTLGLPFGPEAGAPEGVGLTDCIACALELVSAAAALLLLPPSRAGGAAGSAAGGRLGGPARRRDGDGGRPGRERPRRARRARQVARAGARGRRRPRAPVRADRDLIGAR